MNKIIFVRVPRTASTNFTNVLENIYKPNIIRDLVWQEMPAKERVKKLKRGEYFYDFDNMKYPAKNIRKYDAIEGHFLAKKYEKLQDEYDFVTFIRDPVERVISHFNIIVTRQDRLKIDIRKFAKIYKNFHKALIGDDLSLYKFIGITDMFSFCVQNFYKQFDIPKDKRLNLKNRGKIRSGSRKKRPVSAQDRKFITELNAADYEIYNEVKTKYVRQKEKIIRQRKRHKRREEILKRRSEKKNEKTKNTTNN